MLLPTMNLRIALFLSLLLLHFPSSQAGWDTFVIFPEARCFLRLGLLGFDGVSIERFDEFYREDSVQRIAETGEFVGNDIREYAAAGASQSPYFDSAITTSNTDIKWESYDPDTALCTFKIKTVVKQTSSAKYSPAKVTFRTASMGRIVLDLREGYVKRFDNYLPKGYWDIALRGIQESDQARSFVCNVMQTQCTSILGQEETSDCLEKLESLPYTTTLPASPEVLRFNENSQSCRALHAVLAVSQPEMHCPHLSFTPKADPNNKIKCQNDGYGERYTHEDLFTAEELEEFEAYMRRNGFDESGTDFAFP